MLCVDSDEVHLVVRYLDVRVMVLFLRNLRHPVDELHRLAEVLELKVLLQRSIDQRPARHLARQLLRLLFG